MTVAEFTHRSFRELWPEFSKPSWSAWNSIEDAIFGFEPEDGELVRRLTGRTVLPSSQVREFRCIGGRGGGKSRFNARLSVYFVAGRTYLRAPGEQIYVGVFAPDRKQAALTFKYIRGLLRAVPSLSQMIVAERAESIELENGATVEVITASKASPRGRSYALAIVEEAAFLPSDDSADPDRELIRAIRPALARVPGSLLAVVSSAYARRGELYETWKDKFGKDDPSILVVQADTLTLNPSFDAAEIARAYDEDPVGASAEYGSIFRSDVEGFIGSEVVEACTISGRHELPPASGMSYRGFCDPSGGAVGGDSMTLAISHTEVDLVVLDCVREVVPPFAPDDVVREFSETLKAYHVREVASDAYAGIWPKDRFLEFGITVRRSDKNKSAIYGELLPLLNSGRVELLDHAKLRSQLLALERKTSRGGRDSIDHPPGKHHHDDIINAVAGSVVLAAETTSKHRGIRTFDFLTGERRGGWWRADGQWLLYRDGRIVEGVAMPERNSRGQYTSRLAARYENGCIVEYLDIFQTGLVKKEGESNGE